MFLAAEEDGLVPISCLKLLEYPDPLEVFRLCKVRNGFPVLVERREVGMHRVEFWVISKQLGCRVSVPHRQSRPRRSLTPTRQTFRRMETPTAATQTTRVTAARNFRRPEDEGRRQPPAFSGARFTGRNVGRSGWRHQEELTGFFCRFCGGSISMSFTA